MRPEDMENVFKREKFEVIMPFRANSNIWNENKYDIETVNTDRGKIILIIEKEVKKDGDNL